MAEKIIDNDFKVVYSALRTTLAGVATEDLPVGCLISVQDTFVSKAENGIEGGLRLKTSANKGDLINVCFRYAYKDTPGDTDVIEEVWAERLMEMVDTIEDFGQAVSPEVKLIMATRLGIFLRYSKTLKNGTELWRLYVGIKPLIQIKRYMKGANGPYWTPKGAPTTARFENPKDCAIYALQKLNYTYRPTKTL